MATILVAEDHLASQLVLSKRLRNAGHTVLTAANGREALALLHTSPVDLIITDIAMPDMNGLTLVERARADPQHAQTPIVVLTASVLDQDRHAAHMAGADGFLEKPVSSWELESTLRRLLGG